MQRHLPTRRFVPSGLNAPIARHNPALEGMQTILTGMRVAALIGAPIAAAVSYKRNKSIPWAFASGFVWMPYLIYVGISGPPEEK